MEIKYKSNLVGGVAATLLGIVLMLIIPIQIGEELVDIGSVTARSIPYFIAGFLIFCGICLLVQSLILKKDETKVLHVKQELKALLFIACLAVYAFVLPHNFVIPTSALAVVTLAFTKTKKWYYYAIAVAAVVILYFVFSELLNVRLP